MEGMSLRTRDKLAFANFALNEAIQRYLYPNGIASSLSGRRDAPPFISSQ
jgi:hypothetical protein